YTADANTLILLHFDEAAGGSLTVNAGIRGNNAYTVNLSAASATPPVVTTALGAGAYSGFGNSVQLSGTAVVGWDYNASGAYQGDVSASALSADRLAMSVLNMGNAGQTPWTIEALIHPSTLAANQQIISTDSSVAARGFQFRINAAGRLELNCIATGPAITTAIPTTGAHAYAA